MKPSLAVDFPQHGEMVSVPVQYERERGVCHRLDRQLHPVSLHPDSLGAILERPHGYPASRQVYPVAEIFHRHTPSEMPGDHPQAGHPAVRLLHLVVVGESLHQPHPGRLTASDISMHFCTFVAPLQAPMEFVQLMLLNPLHLDVWLLVQ